MGRILLKSLQPVAEYFGKKIDLARLRIQLLMLADAVKTVHECTSVNVTNVTSPRTLADIFNQSLTYKGMLNEVDKVLLAYLTFPVTSSTAERSFSAIRRIKTFLRSTITHERLNNLFLLYFNTEIEQMFLILVAIAKKFVSVNDRRMNYFGKFRLL